MEQDKYPLRKQKFFIEYIMKDGRLTDKTVFISSGDELKKILNKMEKDGLVILRTEEV